MRNRFFARNAQETTPTGAFVLRPAWKTICAGKACEHRSDNVESLWKGRDASRADRFWERGFAEESPFPGVSNFSSVPALVRGGGSDGEALGGPAGRRRRTGDLGEEGIAEGFDVIADIIEIIQVLSLIHI